MPSGCCCGLNIMSTRPTLLETPMEKWETPVPGDPTVPFGDRKPRQFICSTSCFIVNPVVYACINVWRRIVHPLSLSNRSVLLSIGAETLIIYFGIRELARSLKNGRLMSHLTAPIDSELPPRTRKSRATRRAASSKGRRTQFKKLTSLAAPHATSHVLRPPDHARTRSN